MEAVPELFYEFPLTRRILLMKHENTVFELLMRTEPTYKNVINKMLMALEACVEDLHKRIDNMDKKIRTIKAEVKKDAGKEEKKLVQLEKMDKKRDKVCDYGKKMMKKKKK